MRLLRHVDHAHDTDSNRWTAQLAAESTTVVIHAPRAAEVARGDVREDVTTAAPAEPTQPAAAA